MNDDQREDEGRGGRSRSEDEREGGNRRGRRRRRHRSEQEDSDDRGDNSRVESSEGSRSRERSRGTRRRRRREHGGEDAGNEHDQDYKERSRREHSSDDQAQSQSQNDMDSSDNRKGRRRGRQRAKASAKNEGESPSRSSRSPEVSRNGDGASPFKETPPRSRTEIEERRRQRRERRAEKQERSEEAEESQSNLDTTTGDPTLLDAAPDQDKDESAMGSNDQGEGSNAGGETYDTSGGVVHRRYVEDIDTIDIITDTEDLSVMDIRSPARTQKLPPRKFVENKITGHFRTVKRKDQDETNHGETGRESDSDEERENMERQVEKDADEEDVDYQGRKKTFWGRRTLSIQDKASIYERIVNVFAEALAYIYLIIQALFAGLGLVHFMMVYTYDIKGRGNYIRYYAPFALTFSRTYQTMSVICWAGAADRFLKNKMINWRNRGFLYKAIDSTSLLFYSMAFFFSYLCAPFDDMLFYVNERQPQWLESIEIDGNWAQQISTFYSFDVLRAWSAMLGFFFLSMNMRPYEINASNLRAAFYNGYKEEVIERLEFESKQKPYVTLHPQSLWQYQKEAMQRFDELQAARRSKQQQELGVSAGSAEHHTPPEGGGGGAGVFVDEP